MADEPLRNVLDEIDMVLESNAISGQIGLAIPHHPGRSEFSLRGNADTWSPRGKGRGALDELGGLDAIGDVSIGKGDRVGLTLADHWVVERGELLESGSTRPLETGDLAVGERMVVDFCDPNATKALHVGHLRNLAIGNALAALGRVCGAKVVTQSQVGDVGRSMGEAMAGYTMYGEGAPPDRGQKGDHLVGQCYSRFVSEMDDAGAPPSGLASDPVLSREEIGREDLASKLIAGWHAGDDTAMALWRRIRGWVMKGQEQTLERLGVSFDRLLFESDYLAEIDAAGNRLLDDGVAERTPSKAVLHATGDEAYPYMVLRRPDGHSTQHLRYFALWSATHQLLGSATSLQVMGDEWLPLLKHGEEIRRSLNPGEAAHPTTCVLHGMVLVDDEVVKSSKGVPWLIDALLNELIDDPRVRKLCGGDDAYAERLVSTIALGSCLGKPPGKRLSLSYELLLDAKESLGWTLATAVAAAWDPRHDGAPEPLPDDRAYRFLVSQSQVHRRLVQHALRELTTLPLARFHTHLSRWFLTTSRTPRLARAMRTVLDAGMSSLGMQSPVLSAKNRMTLSWGSNPRPAV